MEQVELQTEANVAIVDTMKKSKKKIVVSVICAVYRRDEIFEDRYWISVGPSNREKGELTMSAFGEDGLSINVLYGVELPSKYTKYTFGYRNYQYICPIEDGVVLDVFIDVGGFTNAYEIEMLEQRRIYDN